MAAFAHLRQATALAWRMVVRDERGNKNVYVIGVAPVLLLFTLTVLQGAMFWHANTAAHSVANYACEAQRLYQASSIAGATAGNEYAQQWGGVLNNLNLAVARGADTVTVTVTAQAPSIVPGFPLALNRTVTCPIEQWID